MAPNFMTCETSIVTVILQTLDRQFLLTTGVLDISNFHCARTMYDTCTFSWGAPIPIANSPNRTVHSQRNLHGRIKTGDGRLHQFRPNFEFKTGTEQIRNFYVMHFRDGEVDVLKIRQVLGNRRNLSQIFQPVPCTPDMVNREELRGKLCFD